MDRRSRATSRTWFLGLALLFLSAAGCDDEKSVAHPDTLKTELGYWALEKAKRFGMCQALLVEDARTGKKWVKDDAVNCIGTEYSANRATPICDEFAQWVQELPLEIVGG